jgi:mono/diheme cytochrome c family protein
MNTYTNALKYGDPFEPEDDRLAYPVFEALSQDEQYVKLAQVRHLAGKSHDEAPDAAEQEAFAAWNHADKAVTAYVREWLADPPEYLDDSDVAAAREEFNAESEVPA